MLKCKRIIALLLTIILVTAMLPTNVIATEFSVGDNQTTNTNTPPNSVDGAVWVLVDSIECNKIVHTHENKCYYHSCDHNNGHISTCYSESTAYTVCEHNDDTQHSGSVTLADVVTINGTNVNWNAQHPAYETVYAIYKAAYDTAYESAKYFKDVAGKTAGIAAVSTKKFCYIVSASAEPDKCTHGECSEVGGKCYTKICLIPEHQHIEECFQYNWVLKADINKNGVADDVDTYYTVKYMNGEEVVLEKTILVGMPTPFIDNVTKDADAQYTYTFIGWDKPIADVVTEDVTYNAVYTTTTNTYSVTWKDEDGTILEFDEKVEYGQMPTYDNTVPTKEGDNTVKYTFAGWSPSVETVTGNVIYTAVYSTTDVFKVEFHIDGSLAKTEYVIDGETVQKYLPTREHFVLSDWYVENEIFDFSTAITEDVVLSANWELVEYVVSINGNVTSSIDNNSIHSINDELHFTFMPNTEYIIENVKINGINVPSIMFYETMVSGKIVPADYLGKDEYELNIVVETSKAKLALNNTEMNVYGNLNSESIFNAVYNKELSNPNNLTINDVKVEYLALTIELLGKTYEWWVEPGTEVSIEKFLDQYRLGTLAQYIPNNVLPHEFGKASIEYVRVTFDGNDKYPQLSEKTTVLMKDARIPTSIILKENIVVTYGATKEDILKLIFDKVVAENVVVTENYSDVIITMNNVNAGTQKAIVTFNGNNTYGVSVAEVDVVIKKAQGHIQVNNSTSKYGNDIIVSDMIYANASYIQIAMGLKLGDNASADIENVIYVNLPTLIDVDTIENETIRNVAKELLNQINENINKTMTINELKNALMKVMPYVDKITEAGYNVNISTETIGRLIKVLEQIEKINGTNNVSIQVTIDKDIVLTDAGAYIVAGVITDPNYTVAISGNYAIISPDGYKAELGWNIIDENGIITIDAIKNGYDLGASVVNVAEGNITDANKHIHTIFVGINKNGELIITKDQKEIDFGIYTEVAFMADMGNTMYYAEPIVRTFAVVSDVANVQFVDNNGNINNDRIFAYGENATMNAIALNRVTGEPIKNGTMSYYYTGLQTNGELYKGNTAPTKSGVYTVIAIFVGEDESSVGTAIGSLIIEQQDSQFDIFDATVEFDGNHHFIGISDKVGLKHIFIIVDNCNNVNILLPSGFNIKTTNVYETIEEFISKLNSMNIPDELANYRIKLIEKIDNILNIISDETDIESITINGEKPMSAGTYYIYAIAFGNTDYKIAVDSATLTINTKVTPDEPDPTDPTDPTEPTEPDNPDVPDEPDEPDKPDNPIEPDPNPSDPTEPTDPENPEDINPDVPQTGDNTNVWFWILTASLSAMGIIVSIGFRKKLY